MMSVLWLLFIAVLAIWGTFDWRLLVTGLILTLILDAAMWMDSASDTSDYGQ